MSGLRFPKLDTKVNLCRGRHTFSICAQLLLISLKVRKFFLSFELLVLHSYSKVHHFRENQWRLLKSHVLLSFGDLHGRILNAPGLYLNS